MLFRVRGFFKPRVADCGHFQLALFSVLDLDERRINGSKRQNPATTFEPKKDVEMKGRRL